MQFELDIGEDIDLVRLLQRADPNDVSRLIGILTNGKEGRIALAASVKETLQAAQKSASRPGGRFLEGEIRLLVREFQLFAGNSLRNATRGGGVSYQEAAKDVLQHIGSNCAPRASIEEIELSVLEQLVTLRWQLNDADERKAIASAAGVPGERNAPLSAIQRALRDGGEAAVAVARLPSVAVLPSLISSAKAAPRSTFTRLVKKPAALAAAVVPRLAALPLAAAAAVHHATGEAYRITLPSVVLVAGIRQREKSARSGSRPANGTPTESPAGTATAGTTGLPVTEWVLGPSSEHAVMLASPLQLGAWQRGDRRLVEDDKGDISRLAPLLQTMPGLAAAAQQQGAEYVRVVVNGSLARAADGDGLRGFVRAADGKIVEHARFYEDARLQNLVNSAAVFQIASAVVAQKHLADISARLDSIDKEIKNIHAFLEESRRSVIVGAMDYLKQVAGPVLGGHRSPHIRQKFEDFEAELNSVQAHLTTDIQNLGGEAANLKDPSTIGTAGLTHSLEDIQLKLENLISQWTLCHRTRLAACQLVSAFDGEDSLVKSRLDTLRHLAQDFFGLGGAVTAACASINARVAKMTSKFESTSETFARQIRLDRWHQVNLPRQIAECRASLEQHVPLMALDVGTPLVLAVRLQGQQPEIYDLSEEPIAAG